MPRVRPVVLHATETKASKAIKEHQGKMVPRGMMAPTVGTHFALSQTTFISLES